jgi:hypothetical protein
MNATAGSPDPELLLEAATSAWRERDSHGRVRPSPAWTDLTPDERGALFDRQLMARMVERAADPGGLSSTARQVLAAIAGP